MIRTRAPRGDPGNPANPVGLGILCFVLAGLGLLLAILGLSLDRHRQKP